MDVSLIKFITSALILTITNFVYQYLFEAKPNWVDAFKRSWFQVGALFIAWLTW